MTDQLTPDETLEKFQELFDEFRRATPSSPVWYQLADYCIGVLMLDKLERMKADVKRGHGEEQKR